jgi:ATP-dependent helicase/DNAse subunit B
MAYNPNAVFLSPSSLADFDKCPQLYFLRYVYKNSKGLKIQIINPSLALGQSVHDALDQFLKLEPGARDAGTLEELFKGIWLTMSGEKGGFENDKEESEYRQRGQLMLERFLRNNHFKTAVSYKIPPFPKLELGDDLILTGKLDWLEEDSEGFHVIDFKTGKNEEKEDSLQLPIYAVLAKGIVGDSSIKASYWYLNMGDEFTSFDLPSHDDVLLHLRERGKQIKLARQNQSFACISGKEFCWACRDMYAVWRGDELPF